MKREECVAKSIIGDPSLQLQAVLHKPVVSRFESFVERRGGLKVEKFFRPGRVETSPLPAFGLGCVPPDPPLVPDQIGDTLGEFSNGDVFSGAENSSCGSL